MNKEKAKTITIITLISIVVLFILSMIGYSLYQDGFQNGYEQGRIGLIVYQSTSARLVYLNQSGSIVEDSLATLCGVKG